MGLFVKTFALIFMLSVLDFASSNICFMRGFWRTECLCECCTPFSCCDGSWAVRFHVTAPRLECPISSEDADNREEDDSRDNDDSREHHNRDHEKGDSKGLIIALGVGLSVLGLSLILVLALCIAKKSRKPLKVIPAPSVPIGPHFGDVTTTTISGKPYVWTTMPPPYCSSPPPFDTDWSRRSSLESRPPSYRESSPDAGPTPIQVHEFGQRV